MSVSYSDLQTFGRCPKKHYYRSVQKIQRKRKNENLYQGTLVHEGLKEFFLARQRGAQWDLATKVTLAYYSERFDEAVDNPLLFEDELADARILIDDSQDLVTRYLSSHREQIESWEILHVEEEFTMILSGDTEEEITFTPDLIIRDSDGYVWIIDHKTTSVLPRDGLPFTDLQALVYFAGVQQMYPELRGFIFSKMRKKRPQVPRLNKTHNTESKAFGHVFVNNLSKIDTSFEVLRDFLLEEAPELMGEPAHQRKLAELRDHDRFFWEETVMVSEEQVDQILEHITGTLFMMYQAENNGVYPRVLLGPLAQSMGCAKCEFSRICHTALLGWNTQMVLEEEYEPRDPKNPYEDEEDEEVL